MKKTLMQYCVLFTLCVIGASLSACSFGLPTGTQDRTYYTLNDTSTTVGTSEAQYPYRLLVRNITTSPFVDSQRIIFARSKSTRGYYQLAHWTESPVSRFLAFLTRALERSGLFLSVAQERSASAGDLQLSIDVAEAYHDISSRPGMVHVEVAARLVNLQDRHLVSERYFSESAPAEKYNAAGAVDGFAVAIGQVSDSIVVWIAEVMPELEDADRVVSTDLE